MEAASRRTRAPAALEGGLLAAAACGAAEATVGHESAAKAIDAAVDVLYVALDGVLPSVFVLEHARLWLVAQRGYSTVPDGIRVERGIMGRAVRTGDVQLTTVDSDPDYVAALPGVLWELAVPVLVDGVVVGALNVESQRALPASAPQLVRPLAVALGPLLQAVRADNGLDLPGLARLFVHLGSLREPDEIAGLAAAYLARLLPLTSSQVVVWDDAGTVVQLGAWHRGGSESEPLTPGEIAAARALVDPTFVCQVIDLGGGATPPRGRVVWLPLRIHGRDLGALVGVHGKTDGVDPERLDTTALLAAHVAASLDAAISLQREHEIAVTDALTGILNRRGLERRLDQDLAAAQGRREPLSLLVFDCDDFKDVNDRAGHEFGDSMLREIAEELTQAMPEQAYAARLGGDEFVVVLTSAAAEQAEAAGRHVRRALTDGLAEAGFPLRVSAGISTYPVDGATATALLRAADQALYAAKNAGKNRIAAFRDVNRPPPVQEPGKPSSSALRSGAEGSVLGDALAAIEAIESERTVEGVCARLCKALVFVVGATACSASRVIGDYLVDATNHAIRDVWLGDEAAYRISDFPLTAETLKSGKPRLVSFADGDVDPAEGFVLRELGMTSLLMLPIRVGGSPWGLVELYEMRHHRFTEDDVAIAAFLRAGAERRLEAVGNTERLRSRPPIYELPTGLDEPRGPRTR